MDIQPYIDTLRQDLARAAEAGGDESLALAERLTAPLETTARLLLLEALTAAAEEISLELAPGTVEVRLRGRDPDFVVSPPDPTSLPSGATPAPPVPDDGEGGTTRLNLRLPESLKQAIDAAANAEGLSLNAWLVRAATAALTAGTTTRPPSTSGQRLTGWAR